MMDDHNTLAAREGAATAAWTPRTVRVWQEFSHGKWRAFKNDWFGDWHLSDGDGVVFSDPYLQDVMAMAQEMDERAAALRAGAKP